MEKIINFSLVEDGYLLSSDDSLVKILFSDKTLKTDLLFEFLYSTLEETIEFKFENNIESSLTKLIEDNKICENDKVKYSGEGNFVYTKLTTTLQDIQIKVNELIITNSTRN